jgi:hypothetical protein
MFSTQNPKLKIQNPKMYTLDYVHYFKYLVEQNAQLQHTDALGSRVFAVISQEEAVGDFRSGADTEGWLFRLVIPQWALGENGDGGGLYSKDWLGGFIIAKRFSNREGDDMAQLTNIDDCDRLGEQFATRIIRDCEAGHPLFNYSVRSPQQLQFKALPKTVTADNYAGRLFSFRYQNKAKFCPQTGVWNDNGFTPY